jgi:hypothetical protein
MPRRDSTRSGVINHLLSWGPLRGASHWARVRATRSLLAGASLDKSPRSRGATRPSCWVDHPRKQRAQGMPGARCARSRACSVENTRVSHHGHTGNTRHSPRNGFTAYSALSPVTGLVCHRHQRNCFHQLDASVGASGPHDFAVRTSANRQRRHPRPPHPAPRS